MAAKTRLQTADNSGKGSSEQGVGKTAFCSQGFSPDQAAFLSNIANGKTTSAAADAAAIDIAWPFRWRDENRKFASAWKAADAAGADLIEEEAFRRAVKGVEKPVYRAGEVVGHVADYSDTMLMFLLKARRPERYGPRVGESTLDAEALAKRLNLKGVRDALQQKFAQITSGR